MENTVKASKILYDQLLSEKGYYIDVSKYSFSTFCVYTYNEWNYLEMMKIHTYGCSNKYRDYINLYEYGIFSRNVKVFAYVGDKWVLLDQSVAKNLPSSKYIVPFLKDAPLLFIDMESLSKKSREDIDEEEDIDNGMRNWMMYARDYGKTGEIPWQYSQKQFEKLIDKLDTWADLAKDDM
jgi:hypothetical protein